MSFDWIDGVFTDGTRSFSCNRVIKHITKPEDYTGRQKIIDGNIYALYTEFEHSGYFECYLEDFQNDEIRIDNRNNPNNWYIRHDQIKKA
jgi:hypothetical protein